MPELPEVQTVVDTLASRIVGCTIQSVDLARTDILTPQDCDLCAHLTGRRVESVTRRAKRIVITLDDGNRFYVHLGMSGRLTVELSDAPRPKHTHCVIRFESSELHFADPRRFGGIWWLGKDASNEEELGPEPLTLGARALAARLSRTTRAIKNVLLDQTVIAGLGNIYADEALFESRIHPLRRADRLTNDEVTQLNRAIKRVLRRALKHKGSTLRDYRDANGESGTFQKLHRVYDREGQPCWRCKGPIKRIVLGGRSTHFCPRCQPHIARRMRRAKSKLIHQLCW